MFYLYDPKRNVSFYNLGEGLIGDPGHPGQCLQGMRVIAFIGEHADICMSRQEAKKFQHECLAHGYHFEVRCKLKLVTHQPTIDISDSLRDACD